MPYGLTKEMWNSIENEVTRKFYETPEGLRNALVSGFSTQELTEAIPILEKIPRSKKKIDLINKELAERAEPKKLTREIEDKMVIMFKSTLEAEKFRNDWNTTCRGIRKKMGYSK
jgi:hypothetical protein